ncbi:MAG: M48 family metallopeptidase, partial [Acinetobacter bohemicus]
ETGLSFAQCTIRQPKTRWGSCTSKHDIMLNSALVLFPQEVVRYVCVHELAHTRYFDHSPQFWTQVQLHDPNFQQHQKILKTKLLHCWWFF